MRRIFSYNLAILFYFLQGKTLSVPYIANRIPKETLDSLFDNLESIINNSNSAQNLFYRKIENDFYIVTVEEPQKHILKDYLQEYCEELVNDRLETRNQNVLKWNYVRQEFIKRLAPLNLNCFISTNIYDMPQLAPELIKLDDGGYKLELKIDTARERISEESFNFKCSLNLSSIVEKQEKAKPHTEETEPKQNGFTPQQEKLFNFLDRKAKSGAFSFTKYDFKPYVSSLKGNVLNSALSKLRKRYKEIYNTDEDLIKYDRGEGVFILKNVWNYNTFD